jgi:hypothetical protein
MGDWIRAFKDVIYLGLEQFGRYYSCYRGYVADREDPQNYNRLRLIIPSVSSTNVYDYWAWPKGIDSGKSADGKVYGTQYIPQKGDLVWVEFEGGHPSKPIWSMGYRGKGEVPSEADATDYDCYWFITPKGHVIKINDTKNYIHIKTQQGDYVELNSNSISLVTDKKISLGHLDNSAEPAVLGNKNEDVHTDVQDILQKLTDALNKDVIASTGGPFLKFTNLQAAIAPLLIKATAIKPKIAPTKSKKVTLD